MEAERNKKSQYLSSPSLPLSLSLSLSPLENFKTSNSENEKPQLLYENNNAAPPKVSHTVMIIHIYTKHTAIFIDSTYSSSEHVVHQGAQAPPIHCFAVPNSL